MARLTTYLDIKSCKILRSGFDYKSNLTSAIGYLANRGFLASYVSRHKAMAYDNGQTVGLSWALVNRSRCAMPIERANALGNSRLAVSKSGCDFLVVRASEPSTKESRVGICVRASSYQNFTPFAQRLKQRRVGTLPKGRGMKRHSPLGS